VRHHYETVDWRPDPDAPGPRRARRSVRIQAYVPAPMTALDLRLPPSALAAVSDAEREIAAAQQHAEAIGVRTIGGQLLRSEAIASSQMEGVVVPSNRTIAKAAVSGRHHENAQPALEASTAVTDAQAWAVDPPPGAPDVDDLLRMHAAIARSDRSLAAVAGRFRDRQNWIGRDPHSPVDAEFVPPPVSDVEGLMGDLAAFMRRSDLPPVLQAAAVHAQFETIHPFADGNGRVGRMLIGVSLALGGLVRDVVPPVSLVLARDRRAYVDELTRWRHEDDGHVTWVTFLGRALEEAALATRTLADDVAGLQARWHEQAGGPRPGSAAATLLDALVAHPVVDAPLVERLTGRTRKTAERTLDRLEADGVLQRVTLGRRNRAWESVGHFALLDDFERRLSGGAVGIGTTR
jgi:Fic family protein